MSREFGVFRQRQVPTALGPVQQDSDSVLG
jgi:hypothetical protein